MILAAGLGTRLKPLTDRMPKPLVPVGDAPMIAHVADRLRGAGCAPVVTNVYHHAEAVTRWAEGAGVLVSTETDLLGTAGGIAHAASMLGEGAVLVHNGDVLVDVDLHEVVHAHEERGVDATLVIVSGPARTGNVGTDTRGRIVRLRTETFADGEVSGGEFTGVHIVSARVRASLPSNGCIIGDVYMPHLRSGQNTLHAVLARGFVDIGSVAGYLRANQEWLTRRGARSFVASSAEVDAGVVLDGSIVGDGARVTGDGTLARCVVWPGATVVAPCSDAVIVPHSEPLRGVGSQASLTPRT
jgi:mannose-1-phosphate guanylyltransferase